MMEHIPTIDLTATGLKITELRETCGLSVRDLQEILGFARPQAIYKWQNGLTMPTVDNLVILSATFGVPVDEILVVTRGKSPSMSK